MTCGPRGHTPAKRGDRSGEDYTSDHGQLISDTDAHNLAEAFKRSAINASLAQSSASRHISELQWPPESWRSLAADDPLQDDFIR
jgi:hypothetical protein